MLADLRKSTEQRQTIMTLKRKYKKIRDLIDMGKYDADLAKYIPGLLELVFQGMLDDIDTR